jgi:hypothetical protein
MQWFEGDMLAVQEHLTMASDVDGDGNAAEMRTIGRAEFQKKYSKASGSEDDNELPPLEDLFERYEHHFQRIVYRRFKRLYATIYSEHKNHQAFANKEEEDEIKKERCVETENETVSWSRTTAYADCSTCSATS